MKRARSGKAFARLRALSVQALGRSQRDQLKHARNDHARMLRSLMVRTGNGRQRPVGGLGGALVACAARRALARAAAVRAGRGRAGKALQAMTWSVIAAPRFSRLLDSIGAAQAVSGVMSMGSTASAAVDVDGHLCVWGELSCAAHNAEPIFSYQTPTVMQTDRVECVSCGGLHILALADAGEVFWFGGGDQAHRRPGRGAAYGEEGEIRGWCAQVGGT